LIQQGIFMKTSFVRHPLALAAVAVTAVGVCHSPMAFAETSALNRVTVTGNPLGATDLIAPSDVLTGTTLLLRSQSTLGETLDGTPGVSSTYFGSNASRPVIRGLDGDRIRVLQNSGASVDAAGHSFDHAVPSDPISMSRIEVLRGPGALMYGGSAVGGVVNVMDNRIAQERLFDKDGGVSGKVHLGTATGNAEKSGAVLLETGDENFTLHADAFVRSGGDVAAPLPSGVIGNSAATARGGAVGTTWFGDNTRLGVSASAYRSDYGTVAEDAVTIGMQSNRYALEWDVEKLGGWIQSLQFRASHGDYQHTEYDAGVAGTTFQNTGNDIRITARHAPIGDWQGVLGVQWDSSRFSATGEEAFAPFSRTDQTALFALEELPLSWGRISLGGRWESVQVESLGNPDISRFTPASRRFNPQSYALGGLWNIAPNWQLTGNLSYSERAPKDYELFANGAHIATHAYEIGNANATLEKSTNMDVGVKWKDSGNKNSFQLSTFVNRFTNYLAQEATGAVNAETDLPEYAYTQVPAQFTGWEASGKFRIWESSPHLDLELRADAVRAINTDTNQSLPRIAPTRVGATVVWSQGAWSARLGANHVASSAQTDAYTLTNAALTYQQNVGRTQWLWLAKLDNMGDVLAYSATSILTQTAPNKAPLPGRSFKLGLQVLF
jgi:iron complex outermembrane receptor protein